MLCWLCRIVVDRYVEEAQRQGVDPSALAAQLEDIRERMSPGGASPISSQPEMFATPTMSSPASSPPHESPSPSAEMPPALSSSKVRRPCFYICLRSYFLWCASPLQWLFCVTCIFPCFIGCFVFMNPNHAS